MRFITLNKTVVLNIDIGINRTFSVSELYMFKSKTSYRSFKYTLNKFM